LITVTRYRQQKVVAQMGRSRIELEKEQARFGVHPAHDLPGLAPLPGPNSRSPEAGEVILDTTLRTKVRELGMIDSDLSGTAKKSLQEKGRHSVADAESGRFYGTSGGLSSGRYGTGRQAGGRPGWVGVAEKP